MKTAGIDVEPEGCPVSALSTVTTGRAAAVVDMLDCEGTGTQVGLQVALLAGEKEGGLIRNSG